MKYSGPETTFLAYCTFVRVAAKWDKETIVKALYSSDLPSSPHMDTWPGVNQGRGRTFWSDDLGAITCILCHFNLIAYHSVNFAVTMDKVDKRII
ncbi:hypothetical protein AVEN_106691-1 [Araneus ventricosus]|uniref:Uncharacterized protein n=1 Tax=Araneus ventricosus TaxID=182803 RepID=A0A4Y2LN49_ARAVE|nr:hypothetical protein AVEN_106691-1 [Araneus ventricosus]